jgi:hypothetical protein
MHLGLATSKQPERQKSNTLRQDNSISKHWIEQTGSAQLTDSMV